MKRGRWGAPVGEKVKAVYRPEWMKAGGSDHAVNVPISVSGLGVSQPRKYVPPLSLPAVEAGNLCIKPRGAASGSWRCHTVYSRATGPLSKWSKP